MDRPPPATAKRHDMCLSARAAASGLGRDPCLSCVDCPSTLENTALRVDISRREKEGDGRSPLSAETV